MADENSTAQDNATPEQLAKQYPDNCDPFGVWYLINPGCSPYKWAVNDENGDGFTETINYKEALIISEALRAQKNKINDEQTISALKQIAHMASAIESLCYKIEDDEDGDLITAAANLAAKIGWTADRCLNFDIKDSDNWLMPPAWNRSVKDLTTE